MQGCLRNEKVKISIETSCAHCDRALQIEVDSDDGWELREESAEPLLFSPSIEWERFQKPNIIDDF